MLEIMTNTTRKVSSHTINRRLIAAMVGALAVAYADITQMWVF